MVDAAKRRATGSSDLTPFEHTHLGAYFVGCFSFVCIFYGSVQGIMTKYHLNKKWYSLFGILCLFAYISIRPFIRTSIGSASRGYINMYAVYIMWLVSAVFHHLPTLDEFGMDVKADISIIIAVFSATFVIIGLLNALHYTAVSMKKIPPFLFVPGAGPREIWSAIAVNSMSVAVACSAYFSLCGNAGASDAGNWDGFQTAMCSKWLHPAPTDDFPTFKAWVVYGEISSELTLNQTFLIDYPLDGQGPILMPQGQKYISPVFMLWITVCTMYLVNCLADHVAVQTMQVQHVSQLRRRSSEPLLRKINSQEQWYHDRAKSMELDRQQSDVFPPSMTSSDLSEERLEANLSQPDFLPMVPWYSGTSADLVKMLFDLTVSVKLFLGRFDMRTMLAATSSSWHTGPCPGDGFTYSHLRNRRELWFDFCADTGDGGNSTYTIARAMAAPQLKAIRATVKGEEQCILLPRSDVLFLGGDLAYPGPSRETYQQRLFNPFQDAFPPPPHDKPGRLVVHKPDIPKDSRAGHSECLKKEETLENYSGPQCFAIPGNHDWHDGLDTFIEQILHRGWLGGWILPQEKSYFAVQLPHDWWLFGVDLGLVYDIDMCQYRYFASVEEKLLSPDSQVILMSHEPIWLEDWMRSKTDSTAPTLRQLIRECLRGRCRVHIAGDLHFYLRHSLVTSQPLPPKLSESKVPVGTDERARAKMRTLNKIVSDQKLNAESNDASSTEDMASPFEPSPEMEPACLDPDHLIVNGLGGAFLHPTHIFSGSRFSARMVSDSNIKKDHTYGFWSNVDLLNYQRNNRELLNFPSSNSAYQKKWKGSYHSKAQYPPSDVSLKLGKENLLRFRLMNTRFDIVGALCYYLLVWSILPCCQSTSAILDAPNFLLALHRFGLGVLQTMGAIFLESNVSLAASILLFATCYGFACKGGVGCANPPPPWTRAFNFGKPWLDGFSQDLKDAALRGYKVRTGGQSMKLLFAAVHTIAHLTTAIVLVLILELGVLTCIQQQRLGKDGYHTLYRWFDTFLSETFPDPMKLRWNLTKYTFGIYPAVLKYLMAAYDVPEAVAVARNAICSGAAGLNGLNRLQLLGYYMGMLGYYWLLAPPMMGLIFGVYLYVCCSVFHLHPDEAFSALRIQDHKGFCRFHITPNGDLELFSLATDKIPNFWQEDVQWRGIFGGGNDQQLAHNAEFPSRWIPKNDELNTSGVQEDVDFRVVDYLVVPRKRLLYERQ